MVRAPPVAPCLRKGKLTWQFVARLHRVITKKLVTFKQVEKHILQVHVNGTLTYISVISKTHGDCKTKRNDEAGVITTELVCDHVPS